MANFSMERKKVDHVRGLIIFRCHPDPAEHKENSSELEFLLLKKKRVLDWSPPKGTDKGKRERKSDGEWESGRETARRETEEETGLIEGKDYHLLNTEIHFQYTNPSNILKRVTLWPAQLSSCSKGIRLSKEHEAFRWFKMDGAREIIKEEYNSALNKAIESIIANSNMQQTP